MNFIHGLYAKKVCEVCGAETTNKRFCCQKCSNTHKTKITEEKILSGNYHVPFSGNAVLKKFLIKLRGYRCELCGLTEWMGQPVPLQPHHKDGDAKNNKPDNLTLLCPNCHALTDNFSGKNRNKSSRKYRYAK